MGCGEGKARTKSWWGEMTRNERRDTGSTAQEKGNSPPAYYPKRLFLTEMQQTQSGQRSVLLSVRHIDMQPAGFVKGLSIMQRFLHPINKSDSIILYQNNILAFNEHNCQYPESRIINHYLLLPTLSNFMLRRQG